MTVDRTKQANQQTKRTQAMTTQPRLTAEQQKQAFIDYDETFELWGVYDEATGHCYNMFYTEGEAEEYLKRF